MVNETFHQLKLLCGGEILIITSAKFFCLYIAKELCMDKIWFVALGRQRMKRLFSHNPDVDPGSGFNFVEKKPKIYNSYINLQATLFN